MEDKWWRAESWKSDYRGGIMEKKSWSRSDETAIMEQSIMRWHHEEGHGSGIMKGHP